MIVVVNDANLLIDLIKLELLDAFFQLNWHFHTTEIIFETELYPEQQAQLQPYVDCHKLIVHPLSAQDLVSVTTLQRMRPQLSDKDCSAFVFAERLSAYLLTSDNALRKFALQSNLRVHGHLWVFDALVTDECLAPTDAILKLQQLEYINPKLKLPRNEIELRKTRWQGA